MMRLADLFDAGPSQDTTARTALIDRLRSAFKAFFDQPSGETTETSATNPLDSIASIGDVYYAKTKLETGRMARYRDYDEMDRESGEIQAVFDLVADEATQADRVPFDAVTVESEEEKIKDFFDDFFHRLRIVNEAWALARDVAKYGDDFNEIVANNSKDVVRLKSLDRYMTYREMSEFGLDGEKPFTQRTSVSSQPIASFDPWQVVHFRNLRSRSGLYGMGWAEPARKVWKQLSLMEDGVIITRLTRANARYKILVPTGDMTPSQSDAFIKNVVKPAFQKRRFVDPSTGKLNLRDSPLTAEENFFIPLGKDGKGDAGILQGDTNLGRLQDLEYFRNKLYASMKVPKAFLGLEADTAGKDVIHEIEVSWARSVRRVQVTLIAGLEFLGDVALTLKGIEANRRLYKVLLPPISTIDELREWKVEQLKAEIAKIWGVDIGGVPNSFLLKKYLNLSDEEIIELEWQQKAEQVASGQAAAAADPALPSTEELRRNLKAAAMMDELRDLVDMALDGRAWERAHDPIRRGRVISVPRGASARFSGMTRNGSE